MRGGRDGDEDGPVHTRVGLRLRRPGVKRDGRGHRRG